MMFPKKYMKDFDQIFNELLLTYPCAEISQARYQISMKTIDFNANLPRLGFDQFSSS